MTQQVHQNIIELINPQLWNEHYINKEYDKISQDLINILIYFKDHTYFRLHPQTMHTINLFTENLLFYFTKEDFILNPYYARKFINLNMVTSNLVAMTHKKNTDAQIKMLMNQDDNLLKLLSLYSARNKVKIPYLQLFNSDPEFIFRWYISYFSIGNYATKHMYENLMEHLNTPPTNLKVPAMPYQSHVAYQICSYFGDGLDEKIKWKINQVIQDQYKDVKINNTPNPKKVAVITRRWNERTSIHRTCYGFVESLKDNYHLTLVHLGPVFDNLDTSLFDEVKHVQIEADGYLNLSKIQNNDFMVAYLPDVGLGPESVHLANLRIAPVQIAGYGHPCSTFGSNIDYFLGGYDVERADLAKVNYTEKLVLIPGNASPPTVPAYEPKYTKNTTDKFIIACSWGGMKFNYKMLLNLKEIIEKSRKKLLFRFFPASGPSRYNCFIPFENELAQVLGKENFELIPNSGLETYMSLIEEADISIDSFPYGGYNTAIDMIYLRKPLVAYEGNKFFNRAAALLLKSVGLPELVTKNKKEYINLILKLIHDDDFRMDLTNRLKNTDLNEKVFNNVQVKEFKVMIDYLIENNDKIKSSNSKAPLIIKKSEDALL